MKGWNAYLLSTPPCDALVRFRDEITGNQWTGYARDLHPMFNVAYVWWTLTGIEKMKGQP